MCVQENECRPDQTQPFNRMENSIVSVFFLKLLTVNKQIFFVQKLNIELLSKDIICVSWMWIAQNKCTSNFITLQIHGRLFVAKAKQPTVHTDSVYAFRIDGSVSAQSCSHSPLSNNPFRVQFFVCFVQPITPSLASFSLRSLFNSPIFFCVLKIGFNSFSCCCHRSQLDILISYRCMHVKSIRNIICMLNRNVILCSSSRCLFLFLWNDKKVYSTNFGSFR